MHVVGESIIVGMGRVMLDKEGCGVIVEGGGK